VPGYIRLLYYGSKRPEPPVSGNVAAVGVGVATGLADALGVALGVGVTLGLGLTDGDGVGQTLGGGVGVLPFE
jgi:hypothetical protein